MISNHHLSYFIFTVQFFIFTCVSRWNLLSQCWAQEPDQRPTFRKIQDRLQLFRNVSLNSISQCREEADPSGVINEGFEGKFDSFSEFSGFFLQCELKRLKWDIRRRHFMVSQKDNILALSS